MNLSEFQKKYGIKRIDFSKIKPSAHETEYDTDKLVCPYCGEKIQYEGEEIDDILKGESYKCPECEKWFYVEGEISIDTYCEPLEDAVLKRKRYIEDIYNYMDKCDRNGCEWEERYGNVEWETYKKYAEPLFENMKMEEKGESNIVDGKTKGIYDCHK